MTTRSVRAGEVPGPAPTRDPIASDYDVIVVGGRVAGASTGMLLARQGHRVLIVERASMPSDTVSTHAVLRSGVLLLRKWGVLDRIIDAKTPPIRDITLGFGEERISFQLRHEHGIETLFAPRRYILDDVLAEAAREAGADYVDGTAMTDLLRDGEGRVSGVAVGHRDEARLIASRYVIGADGFRSRVAEKTGSSVRRSHQPMNAVSYAYYDGIDTTGFWFQFTPGVNAGLVTTNHDQVLVFTGRPHSELARFSADPDGEFIELLERGGADLAERVRSGRRASRFHGTSGLPGFIRQAWGPGWALVGDAGYTKDPISAHGISDALRDAELCARAIDRALREPHLETQALDWYETLRDSLSLRMYEESEALARFEWSAEEASARMRVISDEVRAECATLVSLPEWGDVPLSMSA